MNLLALPGPILQPLEVEKHDKIEVSWQKSIVEYLGGGSSGSLITILLLRILSAHWLSMSHRRWVFEIELKLVYS